MTPTYECSSAVKLLLHCNGVDDDTTFIDSGSQGHSPVAHDGAVLKTSVKKFGSAAGYFPAAGSVSVPASPDFALGSEFTVEVWLKIDGILSENVIPLIGIYQDALNFWYLTASIASDNSIGLLFGGKIDGVFFIASKTVIGWELGDFHHVAAVANAGFVSVAVDGSFGTARPVEALPVLTADLIIGQFESYTRVHDIRLDEVRICTVPCWSTDFTPFTSEYVDCPTPTPTPTPTLTATQTVTASPTNTPSSVTPTPTPTNTPTASPTQSVTATQTVTASPTNTPSSVTPTPTPTNTPTASPTLTTPAALLIDAVGVSALSAFSLRKLRSAYAGSAVRIRRSSDNAEQDVGFSGNNFDASSAETFVGAGNAGYVVKWYDQSANTYDASTGTANNQPRLVNNGTCHAGPKAGTYALDSYFSANSTSLPFNTLGLRWPFTISAVAKFDNVTGQNYVVSHQNSGSEGTIYNRVYSSNWQTGVRDGTNTRTVQKAVSTATWYHNVALCDATVGNYNKMGQNGSALVDADGTTSAGNNAANGSALFNRNDNLTYAMDGLLSECVIWPDDLDDTQRGTAQTNTNTYYAIY